MHPEVSEAAKAVYTAVDAVLAAMATRGEAVHELDRLLDATSQLDNAVMGASERSVGA